MVYQFPANSKKIFWDVDPRKLDPVRHRVFIVERILEYGNEAMVRWLFRKFSKTSVVAVMKKSRRLSSKSKRFWRLKLWV